MKKSNRMLWKEAGRVPCDIDDDSFIRGVNVWITKPHVVNRRLAGTTIHHVWVLNKMPDNHQNIQNFLNNIKCVSEDGLLEVAHNFGLDVIINQDLKSMSSTDDTATSYKSKTRIIKPEHLLETAVTLHTLIFLLRTLIPKNIKKNKLLEAVILDCVNGRAEFYSTEKRDINPSIQYAVQYTNDYIVLQHLCDVSQDSGLKWFQECVLPKLVTWGKKLNSCETTSSLSLISVDKYNETYQELKDKYAAKFIKLWTENTDPLKFVYEDIGIASYLLNIWAPVLPQFLDIGCGNGLLVSILAEEGCKGAGVDVKKRKIWDIYSSSTVLKETTIIPTAEDFNLCLSELLPECTDTSFTEKPHSKQIKRETNEMLWLIGNHPDELTPWIPVLAARLRCNFFLLPCCAYSFNAKFERKNVKLSSYEDYLSYLTKLSEEFDFKVERDRLKIPSTKRTCLIGRPNNKMEGNKVLEAMKKHTNSAEEFTPRPAVQPVRNLSQLNDVIVQNILSKVTSKLLEDADLSGKWNAGGEASLESLARLCDGSELQALKQSCGGIQTLLRNHPHIFKIQAGIAQLRTPQPITGLDPESNKAKNLRKKQCWFYYQHPQKCPLIPQECAFKH